MLKVLQKTYLLRKINIKTRLLPTINNFSENSATATATATTIPQTNTAASSTFKILEFNQDEKARILNLINSKDINILMCYDISKTRAKNLLIWQQKNGDIQNLQDILLVSGFGIKVVNKFYRSLLEQPKKKAVDKGGRPGISPFITPNLLPEQQSRIQSCTSVRIGVTSASWARLELPSDNSPCQLTHWQHHDIAEKKLHLSDLVQRCLYVNHLIPAADCYLFESPQMAQPSTNPGSIEQQNINIQKAQITAILSYALTARDSERVAALAESTKAENKKVAPLTNVFYLRRLLTARLFNHLIGTERVSSEQTILKMMRNYYNVTHNKDVLQEDSESFGTLEKEKLVQEKTHDEISLRRHVQFPYELRQMFSKSERFHREFLGQALLLNLAFIRLILLEDAESIQLVTMKGKKSKSDLEV